MDHLAVLKELASHLQELEGLGAHFRQHANLAAVGALSAIDFKSIDLDKLIELAKQVAAVVALIKQLLGK